MSVPFDTVAESESESQSLSLSLKSQEKYPTDLLFQVDHYGFAILVNLIFIYLFYFIISFKLLSYYKWNRNDWGIGKGET